RTRGCRSLSRMVNGKRTQELIQFKIPSTVSTGTQYVGGSDQIFQRTKGRYSNVLLDILMAFTWRVQTEERHCKILVGDRSVSSLQPLQSHKPASEYLHQGSPGSENFKTSFLLKIPNLLKQRRIIHLPELQLRTRVCKGTAGCELTSAMGLVLRQCQAHCGGFGSSLSNPDYLQTSQFIESSTNQRSQVVEVAHTQMAGVNRMRAEGLFSSLLRTFTFFNSDLHGGRSSMHKLENAQHRLAAGISIWQETACSHFFPLNGIISMNFKIFYLFICQREREREHRHTFVTFQILDLRSQTTLWSSATELHNFSHNKLLINEEKKTKAQIWKMGSLGGREGYENTLLRRVIQGGEVRTPHCKRTLGWGQSQAKALPNKKPAILPAWLSPFLRYELRDFRENGSEERKRKASDFVKEEDIEAVYSGSLTPVRSTSDLTQEHSPHQTSCTLVKRASFCLTQSGSAVVSSANDHSGQCSTRERERESEQAHKRVFKSASYEYCSDTHCSNRDLGRGSNVLVDLFPQKSGRFPNSLGGGGNQRQPLAMGCYGPRTPALLGVALAEGGGGALGIWRDLSEQEHNRAVIFLSAA
uniref:Uncharacterized protein n=1 Tax=Neovison vison TaxID=452646 RepID=A0A8C7AJF9_NEOVI